MPSRRDQDCRVAVWIEIDRQAVSSTLLDAEAARSLWNDGNYGRQIIPGVEACHRGAIPTTAFAGILLVNRHDRSRFATVGIADAEARIAEFEASLPPAPPESPIIAILRASGAAAAKMQPQNYQDEDGGHDD